MTDDEIGVVDFIQHTNPEWHPDDELVYIRGEVTRLAAVLQEARASVDGRLNWMIGNLRLDDPAIISQRDLLLRIDAALGEQS